MDAFFIMLYLAAYIHHSISARYSGAPEGQRRRVGRYYEYIMQVGWFTAI